MAEVTAVSFESWITAQVHLLETIGVDVVVGTEHFEVGEGVRQAHIPLIGIEKRKVHLEVLVSRWLKIPAGAGTGYFEVGEVVRQVHNLLIEPEQREAQ